MRQALLHGEPLRIELAEDFSTECGQLRLFFLQHREQPLAKLGDPLWQDDPILTEPPTDLIDECRARFHQSLTDPMEGLKVLLGRLLDWHEAHRGPCDRFPN